MTPDRTAELAATIAATAETARRLAGARYETTIRPWRDLIEATDGRPRRNAADVVDCGGGRCDGGAEWVSS